MYQEEVVLCGASAYNKIIVEENFAFIALLRKDHL